MKKILAFVTLSLTLTSCSFYSSKDLSSKITSINILDRNGLSETISAKERLSAFEKTDFLAPQPYQKVMRVYGRDKKGDFRSTLTSYHPNGQIKQYLEAVNNRASGAYKEWFPNGQLKVECQVIGGTADLHTSAEESWLFDGYSRAWDEEGHLMAEISYVKGSLQGEAHYFHENGSLWKIVPYVNHVPHGTQQIFLENGMLFQTAEYKEGELEGPSIRYWAPESIAYREEYSNGKLMEASYFDATGELVSEIHEGKGLKAIFNKESLAGLVEFKKGIQEGMVRLFDETGTLVRTYNILNGEKEGEEISYFPHLPTPQPMLLMTWRAGVLQGPVKSWYENGQLESQRELSDNKKNGLFTAWYENGSLMLLEEYENDVLTQGEYFRSGEYSPLSKIEKGKGIATLFDAQGNLLKKVRYQDGKPVE